MQWRFGHDFSRVRVHCDTASAASTRHVNANAYTTGHIVFGAGGFNPRTADGRRLLAHELTHVIQQTGGIATVAQRDAAGFAPIPEPADLLRAYLPDMIVDKFDGLADRLVLAVSTHSQPVNYIQDVFELATPTTTIQIMKTRSVRRLFDV